MLLTETPNRISGVTVHVGGLWLPERGLLVAPSAFRIDVPVGYVDRTSVFPAGVTLPNGKVLQVPCLYGYIHHGAR